MPDNRMYRFIQRGCLATSVLLFLGTGPAWGAEEKTSEKEKRSTFKGSVEVNAGAIEEGTRLDEISGRVDVVGREQIENLGAQDLTTALRRVPGVTITRYNLVGGYGGADGGAVFVRGQGAGRPGAEITTAVDGIPRFAGVWTHPLVDSLSLDLASRIEVMKTPQPVRYGNMAFGVVNMVPIKGKGELSGELRGIYGSHDTRIALVESQAGWEGGDVFAVLSHRESNGHRPRSGGRVDAAFLNLGLDIGRTWEARLLVSATEARVEDPGRTGSPAPPVTPVFRDEDQLSILSFSRPFGEKARLELRGYWDGGSLDWLQWNGDEAEAYRSLTDWDNRGIRIVYETQPGSQETHWAAGLDYDVMGGQFVERHTEADRLRTDENFSTTAAWAMVSHDHGGSLHFTPSLGLRVADTEHFGTQWGAQAGLQITIGKTAFYANGARSFNLPGIYAAALYTGWNRAGQWKDLDAEELLHWEVGAMGSFSDPVGWTLSFFHDRVKQAIRFSPPPPFPPSFENIGAYTVRGIEASLSVQPSDKLTLYVGGSAMETDPEHVPETPDWTASAGLSWQPTTTLTCSLDVEAVSDRWVLSSRFPSPQSPVEGFLLANGTLRLRLPGRNRREVFLAVDNLGNEDYAYRPGYPMPKRSFMAGLALGF